MHHVTTLCVRLFGIYKELLVPVLNYFRIRKIASFGLLKKIKEPTSSGHFKNLKNQLSCKRTNTIWWWYGWLIDFSKF